MLVERQRQNLVQQTTDKETLDREERRLTAHLIGSFNHLSSYLALVTIQCF